MCAADRECTWIKDDLDISLYRYINDTLLYEMHESSRKIYGRCAGFDLTQLKYDTMHPLLPTAMKRHTIWSGLRLFRGRIVRTAPVVT